MAPIVVCLMSLAFLRGSLGSQALLQHDYLQFGLLASNKPIPLDQQTFALIAPIACLLFSMQTAFVDGTCGNVNLFYRQEDPRKLSIRALAGIAACVALFTLLEALAAAVLDVTADPERVLIPNLASTYVVRTLFLILLVLFENAFPLLRLPLVGFLATCCATAVATLFLPRLVLTAPAVLLFLLPSAHVYALSGSAVTISLAASVAYLLACSALMATWLTFLLRIYDV